MTESEFPDHMTLGEARRILRGRARDGKACPCPVCKQLVKIYRRKLSWSMAYTLVMMAIADERDKDPLGYLHVSNYLKNRGGKPGIAAAQSADWAKCAHWDLIEPLPIVERDDGSKRNGFWRLTTRGKLFVYDRTTVPRYAKIYNAQFVGLDGEPITIRDALGTRFNYSQLMKGI